MHLAGAAAAAAVTIAASRLNLSGSSIRDLQTPTIAKSIQVLARGGRVVFAFLHSCRIHVDNIETSKCVHKSTCTMYKHCVHVHDWIGIGSILEGSLAMAPCLVKVLKHVCVVFWSRTLQRKRLQGHYQCLLLKLGWFFYYFQTSCGLIFLDDKF